jgi:hypothetical protein
MGQDGGQLSGWERGRKRLSQAMALSQEAAMRALHPERLNVNYLGELDDLYRPMCGFARVRG